MCETNLYLIRNGEEELLMENVDVIQRKGEEWILRDLFGMERSVKARFREAHLTRQRIVLEEIPDPT